MNHPIWPALAIATAAWTTFISAAEPVTVSNVVDPGPNDASEPLAAKFSLEKAVHFLDSASLTWQKDRKCFTCHTNYAYLYARPMISADAPAHKSVRQFAEDLVSDRWADRGPRWDAEVIATAAALAANDAESTGKLHSLTRAALDRMWTIQREDGGWDWLKCNWPPMEHDDHYGVTLAAIAVGLAPDNYVETEAASDGMAEVRRYLRNNPPENLHHQTMLLWASAYHNALITDEQRNDWTEKLFAIQRPDGGWSAAALGNWNRKDGQPQDLKTSDGYGTGFVIYVLRKTGVAATDPRIVRGTQWLKTHQRKSGRWFARSLYRDNKHFLSHAGTAFAVMALAECADREK